MQHLAEAAALTITDRDNAGIFTALQPDPPVDVQDADPAARSCPAGSFFQLIPELLQLLRGHAAAVVLDPDTDPFRVRNCLQQDPSTGFDICKTMADAVFNQRLQDHLRYPELLHGGVRCDLIGKAVHIPLLVDLQIITDICETMEEAEEKKRIHEKKQPDVNFIVGRITEMGRLETKEA